MAEALRTLDRIPAGPAFADARPLTLAVENMHCGNCMRSVEAALTAVPGVASARANLSARRVSIVADPARVDAEACIRTLEKSGFKASLLVASKAGAEHARDSDYLRRLGVAGFAAANIMLLSVSVWAGYAADMPKSLQTLFHWLSAAIAVPAVAYAGKPFFSSAREALSGGRVNMDVPISLGVSLATAMSIYQTIRGSDQVYFDAAITLLFFLLVGRYLDQSMRSRAVSAAENLLGVRSTTATRLLPDGTTQRIATESIVPGMRFLIAAGERIPADGRIVKGGGDLDESLLNGESRPRTAAAGDDVYCGTILLDGPIEMEANREQEDTLIADIARLMRNAEQTRGRYVRLADRAARLYAPAVHALGAATFAGWMIAGQRWEDALTAAIAVLIITCPCALALAVPAVQVVAGSRLFRSDIILKAPDGLERLSEIDTVIFDKTGTLTIGEPDLIDASIQDQDLRAAAGLASASRHPYSKAVVRAAQRRGLPVEALDGIREQTGLGLGASIEGGSLRLGSAAFVGVPAGRAREASLWFSRPGREPIALPLSDPLREDVASVVAGLRERGLEVAIVSGDRTEAVADIARRCGIASWSAEQRPQDKLARIEDLKKRGHRVLMVGDGLNDAPALAAGHASLSPSTATDVSQTAADAIFQGYRLAPVLDAIDVGRAAQRHAKENFAIAIAYNMVFVPMAVVGWVTPLIAAIAMSASSIAVTANALRLGLARRNRSVR